MKPEFLIIITGIMFLLANASAKEERPKDSRFNQSSRLSRKEKADLDFELSLRLLERSRLSDIVNKLQDAGVTVTGFYHTSTWQQHWKSVITEQLRIMDGNRFRNKDNLDKMSSRTWASLLSVVNEMNLIVAGSNENFEDVKRHVKSLNLRNEDRIKFANYHTMERSRYRHANQEERKVLRAKADKEHLSEGEFSTITSLHAYCKAEVSKGKRTFIYYLHNKGGCCEKGSKTPVADWREEMNAFNIEFPSTCLRALLAGYKTCGVEYQDAHYSGNFWWADCNHVAALPGLWDPIDNAYACEYFAFNVSAHNHVRVEYAQACGYNMFHCHVNHYDTLCPREKYLPRILQLVSSDPLPPSQTSDKGVQWVSSSCKKAHEKPYIEAPSSWAGGNMWWKT